MWHLDLAGTAPVSGTALKSPDAAKREARQASAPRASPRHRTGAIFWTETDVSGKFNECDQIAAERCAPASTAHTSSKS